MNYPEAAHLLDFIHKRSLSYLLHVIEEKDAITEWQLLRDLVNQIKVAEKEPMTTRLEDRNFQCESGSNKVTLVFGGKVPVRRTMSLEKARMLALALLQAATRAT